MFVLGFHKISRTGIMIKNEKSGATDLDMELLGGLCLLPKKHTDYHILTLL